MYEVLKKNNVKRKKRAMRVRKHVRGNAERLRLCVVKSNGHIYAQLINDVEGKTVGSTSTLAKEFQKTEFNKKNKASARKIGERIAEIAKEKSIDCASFDRGKGTYCGLLAELAEGARSKGLKI